MNRNEAAPHDQCNAVEGGSDLLLCVDACGSAPRGMKKMEPLGLETPSNSPGKAPNYDRSGAKSGAVAGDLATLADPDLAILVTGWAGLSDDVKLAIMKLVSTLGPPTRGTTADGL
jgi:hypothetical protein